MQPNTTKLFSRSGPNKKKKPCSLKIFAIDDIFLGKFFYRNKKGSKYLKHEKENKKIKCNTYHKKKTKTTK